MRGANVLVLGVAYKNDIDDVRESPAVDIIDRLLDMGARIQYHDSYVPTLAGEGIELECVPLTDETIENADLVLITTRHNDLDYDNVLDKARIVLDTRNVLKGRKSPKIRRL